MGRKVGQLTVNPDGEDLVGVGGGVDQMNGPKLLINQPSRAGLERLEVVAGVGRNLAHLF